MAHVRSRLPWMPKSPESELQISPVLICSKPVICVEFAERKSKSMNPLNPKKVLLTKWTAVRPIAKQKHFLVSKVIKPALTTDLIELVEIEAVFSKATQVVPWRDLQNDDIWRQGWV